MGYLDGTGLARVWSAALAKFAIKSHGRHVPNVCEAVTDWNNVVTNGWYMAPSAKNNPLGDGNSTWFFGYVTAHNNKWVMQELVAFTDGTVVPRRYVRHSYDNNGTITWRAWKEITAHKAVPENAKFTDTVYTHPTTAGNKHIPSGGATGQTLVYSASGTAQWASRLLYLYSATLRVDGWTESGGAFTQTVACAPESGGPALTASTSLSGPMCLPTGVKDTDKAMQTALGIINAGTTTPAAAKVTCKVWKKPTCDCTVYWYGKG